MSSPEVLLARILERVPQPVWVVDHSGFIIFANPAACSALGYHDPRELRGKPSHETVHYRRQDGTPFPEAECLMLQPRQTGETVHSDDDWFVRRDAGKRIEVKLDDDVQKRYVETLATLVSSIASGFFPGKPSEKPRYMYVDCEFCTPGGLGHDQARARYERKRHRGPN